MSPIMAASAVAPGVSHMKAMQMLSTGANDPILGAIGVEHVQLCPQHAGKLSEEVVDALMQTYPDTAFRIHATPRVSGDHHHRIVEAVDAFDHPEQMDRTAALSRRMGAKGYTLHAGQASLGTLEQACERTRRLADLFGCPVGLEGLYPSLGRTNRFLLSTWEEHEMMLEADVPFAIDLSHANIIAKRERNQRLDLVTDLVSSKNAMEIHLSDNNMRADSHKPLVEGSPPWWIPLMSHFSPGAMVFYEGILFDPRRRTLPNRTGLS